MPSSNFALTMCKRAVIILAIITIQGVHCSEFSLINDIENVEKCIEDTVQHLQLNTDASPKIQDAITELKIIKTNLFLNRAYHDSLNTRELKNIYKCYLNAFHEEVAQLGYIPTCRNVPIPAVRNSDEVNLALQTVTSEILSLDTSNILVRKIFDWQASLLHVPRSTNDLKANLLAALKTADLAVINKMAIQLQDLKITLHGQTPEALCQKIVKIFDRITYILSNSTPNPHVVVVLAGEFAQAIDTLAHLIQTRLQHDERHAVILAEISTTLIKTPADLANIHIISKKIQQLARLSQFEFEESPGTAHVELFMGGFSNILVVATSIVRSFENDARITKTQIEFKLDALNHKIQSIFPGTLEVKLALAVQAIFFSDAMKKLDFDIGFTFLESVRTLDDAKTARIKDELSAKIRVMGLQNMEDAEYLAVIQSLSVQVQNIFRLSHEPNLQVLFVHITSTMRLIQSGNEEVTRFVANVISELRYDAWIVGQKSSVDLIQQLIIETYATPGIKGKVMLALQSLLIDLQRLCINEYVKKRTCN